MSRFPRSYESQKFAKSDLKQTKFSRETAIKKMTDTKIWKIIQSKLLSDLLPDLTVRLASHIMSVSQIGRLCRSDWQGCQRLIRRIGELSRISSCVRLAYGVRLVRAWECPKGSKSWRCLHLFRDPRLEYLIDLIVTFSDLVKIALFCVNLALNFIVVACDLSLSINQLYQSIDQSINQSSNQLYRLSEFSFVIKQSNHCIL